MKVKLCPYCNCGIVPLRCTYCSITCASAARRASKNLSGRKHSEKNSARATAWQQANRERRKQIQNDYYARNKALIAEKMKERAKIPKVIHQQKMASQRYRERHSEEILIRNREREQSEERKQYHQDWKARNKDKVKENNARQKNRRKFGGNRFIVLKRDSYTCQDCGVEAKDVHHLDHSGQTESPNNELSNLITLCKSCHAKRHLNEESKF